MDAKSASSHEKPRTRDDTPVSLPLATLGQGLASRGKDNDSFSPLIPFGYTIQAAARDLGRRVWPVNDVFQMNSLVVARQAYAERLRRLGPLKSERVVQAFATVPRERFVGGGPWRIIPPGKNARMTPDSDPCHLYDNVLVSLDADRNINNGEPRLWAALFDQLDIQAGAAVAHVGSGTGYYSAILAGAGRTLAEKSAPSRSIQISRYKLGRIWRRGHRRKPSPVMGSRM